MGLDMYLEAEKYVGDWDSSEAEEKAQYAAITAAIGLEGYRCEGIPSLDVSITVAYWRKANAVHAWFVKNVQNGKDDCRRSYVVREQLETLVAECKKVLDSVETVEGDIDDGTTYYGDGRVEHHTVKGRVIAQPAIAAKVLPTQGGFFFGDTEYTEHYLRDLTDTVGQLRTVLDNPVFKGWAFYYRASW
jgi:hypothetical protein